jgi:mercuric ion transport protein
MSTVAQLKSQDPLARGNSAPALTLAGVAALLASACCVLPLLLAVVGISGAWISQMRWLQPYSTGLMALAVASLGLAAWRLFRSESVADRACDAGDTACRNVNAVARRWFWLIAILTLIPLLVPLAAPMFY